MKRMVLLLAIIVIQHTCSTGDTLQSVAERYCKGTEPRQVAEFCEGIRELNYDAIGESEVWAGLVITINQWE